MRRINKLFLSALLFVSASAVQAEAESIRYSTVGSWEISAYYDKNSVYTACMAQTLYRDQTHFFINVSSEGKWSLGLFNKEWRGTPGEDFRVDLYVDRRLVDRNFATWLSRADGAMIDLGKSVSTIRELMRGQTLAIVSAQGTSKFSLKGSYRASLQVATCNRDHIRSAQAPGGGAFGGSAGAFGATRTQAVRDAGAKAHVLPRAPTLEVAAVYLGATNLPYRILPADENEITEMPVNWKYGKDSLGGMMIIDNPAVSGEQVLTAMLKEQAGVCVRKSAIGRKPLQTTRDGAKISSAEGVCQTDEASLVAFYKILELDRRAVVVLELAALADETATREFNTDYESGSELLAVFPSR